MDAYLDFAYVYDELMDETPYELWCDRVVSTIEEFGISKPKRDFEDVLESERNLVLDLGCGTGTFTEMLYDAGFDMIGIDNSEDMLQVAMEKRMESGSQILYLHQDMRELELYSTIGTVVSVCDSINYLLEKEDVEKTFSLVHNYLYPGGIFIFDFNTVYKYSEVIGNTTIAENREDCSFIWENTYNEETQINEYDLTIFVQEEDELFRRFNETHYQRGYQPSEIVEMLEKNGFEVVQTKDSDSWDTVKDNTERVYVVARCIKK